MKKKVKSQPPILSIFFEMLINIKTQHFVTKYYSVHKTTDELYDSINELHDKFLEAYMGKYGRLNFNETQTIEYKIMTLEEFKMYLSNVLKYIDNDLIKYISHADKELHNLIDEIKLAINKSLYLLETV